MMEFISLLLVFFLSWWLVWMMVLPLGIRSQFEDDDLETKTYTDEDSQALESPMQGDLGAPINPDLLKKLILTTLIALLFVGVFWLSMTFGLVAWLSGGFIDWVADFVSNRG